jgi:hypothetical protein
MKKLFIVILGLVAFLAPAQLYAQSCGVIRHGPIYTPPAAVVVKDHVAVVKDVIVKEVPIAVPVLVPAFQFQYQPPCYAPPIAVPPPVAGYGAGYGQQPQYGNNPNAYGNGPPAANYGQPPSAIPNDKDKIRELAKALLEEIQRQSNDDGGPPVVNGGAPAGNPPAGQPTGNPPGVPTGTPPGVPPGVPTGNPTGNPPGVPKGMTAEQAAPLAIAALQRNCASCHTGMGSKGDTIIFSQPGVLDPNAPWRAMKREIESGRMPPKQSQFRPTPDELQALRIWLGSL